MSDDRACYNCNKTGHQKRDCPEQPAQRRDGGRDGRREGSRDNRRDGRREGSRDNRRDNRGDQRGEIKCYNCNGTGHFARDCQEERKPREFGGNRDGNQGAKCYNC